MYQTLIDLNLREELTEPRKLCSGKFSNVFWDIEKLFRYPKWVRIKAIEPFIFEIGKRKPGLLVGMQKGGYLLAKDIAECLNLRCLSESYYWCPDTTVEDPFICLIDDVLTTGNTIRNYLKKGHVHWIAVLVNRSKLTEINGIPIISGLITDIVQ